MEGALKLKEMSYIHAEGYSGGALKHGPFALIDGQDVRVAIFFCTIGGLKGAASFVTKTSRMLLFVRRWCGCWWCC